ncbi:hypothetical protein ZWY2020_027507 [Hordeum vulgare]|nr:hypothetical protein ZWY2020_027507 [Hordeum vulgare]
MSEGHSRPRVEPRGRSMNCHMVPRTVKKAALQPRQAEATEAGGRRAYSAMVCQEQRHRNQPPTTAGVEHPRARSPPIDDDTLSTAHPTQRARAITERARQPAEQCGGTRGRSNGRGRTPVRLRVGGTRGCRRDNIGATERHRDAHVMDDLGRRRAGHGGARQGDQRPGHQKRRGRSDRSGRGRADSRWGVRDGGDRGGGGSEETDLT